jgi:flagellar L-ring protein precursor FlgH
MAQTTLRLRSNANRLVRLLLAILVLLPPIFAGRRDMKGRKDELSPIDKLLLESPAAAAAPLSMGSTYLSGGNLADMATDFRAAHEGDILTVVVADQASAAAQGVTSSKRASSAKASIDSLFGPKSAAGALTNLAQLGGQQQLDGQGTTSRQTNLSTTVSTRVTRVLSNGSLIIEGSKLIAVNSEQQTVSLRGVVRPTDISPDNRILSNQVANLEVRINGRGVVNDAIRRPNVLYRLLLGVLPF